MVMVMSEVYTSRDFIAWNFFGIRFNFCISPQLVDLAGPVSQFLLCGINHVIHSQDRIGACACK